MISRALRESRFVAGVAAALPALLALPLSALAQEDAEDDPWGFDDLEEVEPTLLELLADQAPDLLPFLAFATLAMVSFLRNSRPLKYVTLAVSVAWLGFAKSQILSVVDVLRPLSGFLPPFSISMTWYVLAGFTLVTTILWGRVYCGRICAFGAFTQLLDAIVPRRFQLEVPAWLERRAGLIKYGILLGAIGYYLATREIAFYRYIEPFWMFTRDATPLLWAMLGLLLVVSIFIRNFYCRFLCPLGAALGLLSTLTIFRIKRWSECGQCQLCEKTCEWGAIRDRKIVMTECVRCDDCEILYANEAECPHWLLDAKRRRRDAAGGATLQPAAELRPQAGSAPSPK